jgi:hypothetical protein
MPLDTPDSLLDEAVRAEQTARTLAYSGDTRTAQRFFEDRDFYFAEALKLSA